MCDADIIPFTFLQARHRMSNRPETSAATYFERTECVAGVQDMRFQEMMPDVLSWFGITRIDKFVSMSDMKFEPIVQAGIEVVEHVARLRCECRNRLG